jgi:hypothetical protein
MWLVDRILESGVGLLSGEYEMAWFPGDDLLAATRPRGLPIGNLTSQFWANCYLDTLDQFIKRELKCPAYLRFVDDMLFFADDKRRLWEWRAASVEFLAGLRIAIHENRSQPRPVTEGVPFLGFTVYPDHRRLKRRKGVYFQQRFKRLVAEFTAGRISFDDLDAAVQGWVNHACTGDTWGLRRAVLGSAVLPGGVP